MSSRDDDYQQQGQQGRQNRQNDTQQDTGWGQSQPQQGRQPPTAGSPTQSSSVTLLAGEELLIDARPAWSAYSLHFLIAAIILPASLVTGEGAAIAGGLVLAAIIAGYVWYLRKRVRYVVTDRRMMVIKGISAKETNEAWMVDIRGMKTGTSLLERLLGHGHLTVSSDITSGGLGRFAGLTFGGIADYEEIAHTIPKRQNEAKKQSGPK